MKQNLLIFVLSIISMTLSAQSADELYDQAFSTFEKNDFKTTLKLIDKAIELDKTKASFYILKAESHIALKQFQQGFDTYTIGIEAIDDNSSLYLNRGNLLMSVQQFEYAIEDFNQSLIASTNEDDRYSSLLNRSAAKYNTRDFQGAYDDLMIVYWHDSTNVAILSNLGTLCDEIGRPEETLKYLHKAIEVDPDFYPAYGNIGFKYQQMGEHAKAIEYFNKVLEFDPNEALGFSNRSYSKLQLGDVKGAMQDIEKSLKLYPSNSYAYKIRALIHIENKNLKKACVDLQKALDIGYTSMYGKEVLELQKQHCGK